MTATFRSAGERPSVSTVRVNLLPGRPLRRGGPKILKLGFGVTVIANGDPVMGLRSRQTSMETSPGEHGTKVTVPSLARL